MNSVKVFKLYIDKNSKEITVTRNNAYFFRMNYYTDTIDHRIPRILHKAMVDNIIIPGIGFDLAEAHGLCMKYFIRITNSFTDIYTVNYHNRYISTVFDEDFLKLYDILFCNVIVNEKYIFPAFFKSNLTPLSSLDFGIILEDLDRHVAEYRYSLSFPKYFHMDLSLINKVWYEKIYC